MSDEQLAMSFKKVGKQYLNGTTALDSFSLTVKKGEFISFLGPSGCGKSTALKMAAGLSEQTEGEISVFGRTPKQTLQKTNDIGFVFQEANLLPWRKVLENVMLPLELRGGRKAAVNKEAMRILELVGLKEYARAYPRELSGGMKMRVSIARTLVAKPKVLLMDEPFAALDELTRQSLQSELLDIWEREQMTILFVTHNVYEAVYLSTSIAVMSSRPGRLTANLDIDLPYPRMEEMRTSPQFVHYVEQASMKLEQKSGRRETG
ncbi:ABC transporter ATP-binding protein [Alkalicoccobacillus gibsonii]|uniref:ABC transporter ATP-binding protein n=1 Tax=Alkalicoccobacillus gibsonii TaxID=79881 RepID=UPI0035178082